MANVNGRSAPRLTFHNRCSVEVSSRDGLRGRRRVFLDWVHLGDPIRRPHEQIGAEPARSNGHAVSRADRDFAFSHVLLPHLPVIERHNERAGFAKV
jgi:hypothetical protein